MRLCRVALKQRWTARMKKKSTLDVTWTEEKEEEKKKKNRRRKGRREKKTELLLCICVWYNKKNRKCAFSFEFHSCNSDYFCTSALCCFIMHIFEKIATVEDDQFAIRKTAFTMVANEMISRFPSRDEMRCDVFWSAWYTIKNSLCVKMCTSTVMTCMPCAHKITLIEHEHRLIQFDSISRARARTSSTTVLFVLKHLLNHIKLIRLEKCRLPVVRCASSHRFCTSKVNQFHTNVTIKWNETNAKM